MPGIDEALTEMKIEVAVLKSQVNGIKDDVKNVDTKVTALSAEFKNMAVEIRKEIKEENAKVFKVFYWFLSAGGIVSVGAVLKWVFQGGLSGV